MTIAPALRILAVAALCVAGLIGLVIHEGAARAGGTEVMMETAPVDPRSLLSGHYVQLNLQTTIAGDCSAFNTGENAHWLSLARSASDDRAPAAPLPYAPHGQFESRTQAASNAIAVRGSATCSALPDNEGKPQNQAIVQTTFDHVSRFYIEQTEAERIGRLLNNRTGDPRVLAILSIGTDGRARLKGLWVEGQRLELSWL